MTSQEADGPIAAGLPPTTADGAADPDVAERLDRAMLRLRRILARPPAAALPIPSLGHCVEFAKVMACLAVAESDHGDGSAASVKDVAAALQLEHSTASRLLGDTEADGLVERRGDPRDRRRTVVTLTDDGRRLVADSTTMRTRAIAAAFAGWERADLEALAALLERMVATLVAEMPGVVAGLSGEQPQRPPC